MPDWLAGDTDAMSHGISRRLAILAGSIASGLPLIVHARDLLKTGRGSGALAPGSPSITVNGTRTPAPVASGDFIWVQVTKGAGGPYDGVYIKDAANVTYQYIPVGPGDTPVLVKLQNDIGGGALLAPGSYNVILISPSPDQADLIPITVTSYIQPPFPQIDGVNGVTWALVNVTPTLAGSNLIGGPAVVSGGPITVGGGYWISNGAAQPNSVTVQYYLNSTPLGAAVTSGTSGPQPPPTMTFDSRSFADGSYMLWGLTLDCADTNVNHWPAYPCFIYPRPIIIMNGSSGPSTAHDPAGTHLIPTTYFSGNARLDGSTVPDHIPYNGLPQANFVTPYPGAGQLPEYCAPAFDPSSIYHANPAALRNANVWRTEACTATHVSEYKTQNQFCTTLLGGIFTGLMTSNPGGASSIEEAFPTYSRATFTEGGRGSNMITGQTMPIASPTTGPFATGQPFAGYHWTCVMLDGSIFLVDLTGKKLVIGGYTRDLSKLPLWWLDPANPQFGGTIQVGGIDSSALYYFSDFGGGLNDCCWDPRDSYVLYVTQPIDHCIIKLNFHTQTYNGAQYGIAAGPGGTPKPLCQRFAGYKKGVNGDGVWTFQDGPALVTSGIGGAQFGGCYSICQQKRTDLASVGHPQGTMYVADFYNGLIRKISAETLDADGNQAVVSTVTTLCGLAGKSTPPCATPWPSTTEFYDKFQNKVDPGENDSYSCTLTWIDSGHVACVVTDARAPTTIVSSVGWYVVVNTARSGGGAPPRLQDTTVNAGGSESTYGIYSVTSFTDSTHFTLAIHVSGQSALPNPGWIQIWHLDTYSTPLPTPLAAAKTPYPAMVRMTSSGDIIEGETTYNHMLRRIWLSGTHAGQITRIGNFGNLRQAGSTNFGFHDVDDVGACGPVDDIVLAKVDSNPGSASLLWRWAIDGSYGTTWQAGVFGGDSGPEFPVDGSSGKFGHYPWGIAFSKTQARIASTGLIEFQLVSSHAVQSRTEPTVADVDHFLANNYLDCIGSGRVLNVWIRGSHVNLPYLLRPSFNALYGIGGQTWFGAQTGLPTFDQMWATHPTDFSVASGGASGSGTLAAFIQSGMGGKVARPEFAVDDDAEPPFPTGRMGRTLAAAVYYIRRQSMRGSWPGPVYSVKYSLDFVRPNVTVQSGDPSRQSATSIRVRWTTDKNTLGLIAAGTANSHGKAFPYTLWSPLESVWGKTHDVTITGLPSSPTPTYVAVLVIDKAGNWNRSAEFAVN